MTSCSVVEVVETAAVAPGTSKIFLGLDMNNYY